ncbi:MAG: murein transglycosylase [Rhodospirillaceae bacterium]|jgi:membrane-bound lytic murein transglycosylase A|nr:murein transglycosylase [Rhodospirillaceae bacterium]MBT3494936.1 murein transglycosylase [Rhodospirillaceae bacterium]MBT3780640.1 murein transglycosylase [Rhodospirillaceae bacterium]MBT3975722.1 murein transglycosylase [Rhodospirillaceae bacterium]MBT5127968.1 murein transglycosylase [Rhodospirillaceae bacterium]
MAKPPVSLGRLAVALAGPLLVAVGLLLWWLTLPAPFAPEDQILYKPVPFSDLDGWRRDNHGAAMGAFLRSCETFGKWPGQRALSGRDGIAGLADDWSNACRAGAAVAVDKPGQARQFFEAHFQAVAVTFAGRATGLFTGYYEPSLRGSRERGAPYTTPLYGLPKDLINVDLGQFSEELQGKRIVGRLQGRRLTPYPERQGIVAGALAGRGLEIVYVDDPVDAFFLQIQGSGRVQLGDGEEMRLGYAGGNGRRYYAIGRELIKRGILSKENVSMQSIRAWLSANPLQGEEVMDLNASYIFFRELQGTGPIGALGVALTPGRSIAVDRRLIPLGIPVWLQASHPAADPEQGDRPLHRLVLAQDTGGAIKGGVRGDIFWGHGPAAAAIAGRMKNAGQWFLLLPKALAARL